MSEVIVVGGSNIDIKAKSLADNKLGTSNPGVISTSPGGVGRNIAHNLARLGAAVGLISVVGSDTFGDIVFAATTEAGVDVSAVQRTMLSTGTYIAMLDSSGEMTTAMSDMRAVDEITPEVIVKNRDAIEVAKFVVADCNLSIDTLRAIAAMAAGKMIVEPVSVTKSRKLLELLSVTPIFLATPNFDQIDELAGTRDINEAFTFLHGKGLRNAVIHAGSDGAFVSNGTTIDHVEPQLTGPIVDVTGAGDAAVSGLVFGLLRGHNLVEAAALGQQQAGLVLARQQSTLE